MEDAFAEEIKKRGEDFKFYQDQYGEHPDDRVVKNDEVSEKMADLQTLTQIFGGLKEKVYLKNNIIYFRPLKSGNNY